MLAFVKQQCVDPKIIKETTENLFQFDLDNGKS